jgi:ADP-heptose:LPS heptosyltransferase
MLKTPKEIKNILVVRNDRFGEFLLNIPAFRALRETFVDAKVIAAINPYLRELADEIPYINEIIEWGNEEHSLFQKLKLVSFLKSKNIDIAVMLNPSKEFNVFTYLAGIPVRAGYDRKLGFLLTHKIKDRKYLGDSHEIEYNLELAGLVKAETENTALSLRIDDEALDLGISNFENLVAIHPWTSDPIKQWPLSNFCGLAKRLIRELNVQIVIVGGKEEIEKSKKTFDNFDDKLINLTGKTSLKQLAQLFKKVKLLISGDSGPVHLACCVGAPVIAIFRNDIPGKSATRWGPWGEGHSVIEKSDLNNISVDEVLEKAKEKLKG